MSLIQIPVSILMFIELSIAKRPFVLAATIFLLSWPISWWRANLLIVIFYSFLIFKYKFNVIYN